MERFDFNFPPYEFLNGAERAKLQSAVDIAFFNDEDVIIEADQPVDFLYVIIKGLVREVSIGDEVVGLYHARDTFEARALVEGHSAHRFIVQEQALVYTIPKATITELMESNPRFGAYFYASVADKLSSMARNKNTQEMESLITARVRDAYRHNATWLQGSNTILQAAQAMKENKTKSILIEHGEQMGLFTESAFRDIVIAGAPTSEELHKWTQFALISIDIDDYVFNALLRMTQFKIQRVVVTEKGKPIGALEQIDVLAYFSNHSHLVAQRLDKANSVDDLVDIAEQMTRSIQTLHSSGVRAPQLAQLMQVLNTSLFEKAWRLIAPTELYENSCLIVMGSEGRGEQILKTDQDNALILGEGADIEAARAAADEFSTTLTRLGYPPCKGKIMVNNPEWRKPLPQFKEMIYQWCTTPNPDALMNLAIFIDAKPVAGNTALLTEAQEYLGRLMSNDAGMLMGFARAVEMFDHHSTGFFSQLLNRDQSAHMDIKKMGIFPVVHGARALSLESHLEETNTFDRLHQLSNKGILDEALAKDVGEALTYMMDIRLKSGLEALSLGVHDKDLNELDTTNMSTLERDLLKDALQVVKRFKAKIRQHFHLGNA